MDLITAILTRTQSGGSGSPGGSGRVEEKKYTFDGNASGKETMNVGYNLVKVFDEFIDLSKVTKVYFNTPNYNEDFFGSHIIFDESEPLILMWQESFEFSSNHALPDGTPIVISVPEDMEEDGTIIAKGTYVFCDVMDYGYEAYVSSIVTEVVHPIDPKYIPEEVGSVQIIDLDKYHLLGTRTTLGNPILAGFSAGGESFDLEIEEDFWSDLNTKKPLRVQLDASLAVPTNKQIVEVDIMRKTPDKNPITVDVRVKGVS